MIADRAHCFGMGLPLVHHGIVVDFCQLRVPLPCGLRCHKPGPSQPPGTGFGNRQSLLGATTSVVDFRNHVHKAFEFCCAAEAMRVFDGGNKYRPQFFSNAVDGFDVLRRVNALVIVLDFRFDFCQQSFKVCDVLIVASDLARNLLEVDNIKAILIDLTGVFSTRKNGFQRLVLDFLAAVFIEKPP